MKITSIRGAITTKNTVEDILKDTTTLLKEMKEKNHLEIEDIVSIFFSSTDDLNKVYPAKAARELGILNAGLMCFQEMQVEYSLKNCIRVMFLVNKDIDEVSHIYLKEARSLRPDLIK